MKNYFTIKKNLNLFSLLFILFAAIPLHGLTFDYDDEQNINNILEGESLKKHKKKFKYDLALCAIFHDEAEYLKEWIEFHRLVGVQHFYLYNNNSTDNYLQVLKPYIKRKIVELIDWPYPNSPLQQWTKTQTKAYENAVKRARKKARWLAILDTDEFLYPLEKNNLVHFLKDYEKFGGVLVNWQMFGTSGVPKIPSNQLMIETLVMKSHYDYEENKLTKSIVHPYAVKKINDPHIVVYKNKYFSVNEEKIPLHLAWTPYVSSTKIRINHYWSRDEWFFWNVKCARRQGWAEGFDGQVLRLSHLNEVYDGCILRFVPRLRKKMGLR